MNHPNLVAATDILSSLGLPKAQINARSALTPAIYSGLKRDSFSVKPLGSGIWECAVQYAKFESDSQFTFDTGGGTQHVSQALRPDTGW